MIITRLLSPGFNSPTIKIESIMCRPPSAFQPSAYSAPAHSWILVRILLHTGACANVALLTYLHRLQSGHTNIIEKYGVNWKMHFYADNIQLYNYLRVNTIERSEAYLQDIVQWRLKLSKTELIWFWLDRGHSIEKFQQQPLIRLNSQNYQALHLCWRHHGADFINFK